MDEDIAPAQLARRFLKPRFVGIPALGHIEHFGKDLARASRVDLGLGSLDLVFLATEERDIGAFGSEQLKRGEAQPMRTAIHDDFLASESQIHSTLSIANV